MRRYKRRNNGGGVIALTLLMVIVIGLVVGFRNAEVKRNYAYTETTTYYVEKGDTLWTIAQEYSDNRHDTRKVIYEIEKLSGCTATIFPGDRLTIPVYEVMK